MDGAIAPQVSSMVQPGQENGNALVDAFIAALTVANVGVSLVACSTQGITLAVCEAARP